MDLAALMDDDANSNLDLTPETDEEPESSDEELDDKEKQFLIDSGQSEGPKTKKTTTTKEKQRDDLNDKAGVPLSRMIQIFGGSKCIAEKRSTARKDELGEYSYKLHVVCGSASRDEFITIITNGLGWNMQPLHAGALFDRIVGGADRQQRRKLHVELRHFANMHLVNGNDEGLLTELEAVWDDVEHDGHSCPALSEPPEWWKHHVAKMRSEVQKEKEDGTMTGELLVPKNYGRSMGIVDGEDELDATDDEREDYKERLKNYSRVLWKDRF